MDHSKELEKLVAAVDVVPGIAIVIGIELGSGLVVVHIVVTESTDFEIGCVQKLQYQHIVNCSEQRNAPGEQWKCYRLPFDPQNCHLHWQ